MRSLPFIAVLLFTAAVPCGAQGVPPLLPPPPPPPTGPATRALNDAFTALNRARALDPAAAVRADFAYQSALSRLRMGDTAGALAEAARARGIAGAAAPIVSPGSAPVAFPVGRSPATGSAEEQRALLSAPLPPYIERARDAVVRSAACGTDTKKASVHLRNAIDAYTSGDAARARNEARAATQSTFASSRSSSECRRTTRTS